MKDDKEIGCSEGNARIRYSVFTKHAYMLSQATQKRKIINVLDLSVIPSTQTFSCITTPK